MDEDLKKYLEAMEARLATHAEAMETRLVGKIDRAAEAFATEVGSLHTQIQQSEARLGAKLESIDARLKLQAGLIQSGARAMARFSEFAESSEQRWVALVARVEALERKVG